MSLIFKQATEEDAPDVHALIQLAFGEYRDSIPVSPGALNDTLEAITDAVRKGTTIILLDGELELLDGIITYPSTENAQLVGTARYETRPDYLYVGRVAVHPDHRRQGIGASLMRHIEGLAPSLGYTRLHLETRASMPGNIAFYEGLGYTIVNHTPNPKGPDINVSFEKELTGVDTRETLLNALVEQLQELPGLQIASVRYSFLSYEADDPEYADLDVPLLYLGSEIELRFDGADPRYLSWGTNRGWGCGPAYSLHVASHSHFTTGSLQSIDAGLSSAWTGFLGRTITHIDVLGWDGVPNVCRFGFHAGNMYVGTGHQYTFTDGDDLLVATEEGWQSQPPPPAKALAHLVSTTEGPSTP
jgi:ribosomal protein S18 acetylase RimI-like enzyme